MQKLNRKKKKIKVATVVQKIYRWLKQASATDIDSAIEEYNFNWNYKQNEKNNFKNLAIVINDSSVNKQGY